MRDEAFAEHEKLQAAWWLRALTGASPSKFNVAIMVSAADVGIDYIHYSERKADTKVTG